MKKLIVWVSIICIGSSLIGCAQQQTSNINTENTTIQGSVANSNVINSQEFIKCIEKTGYKIKTLKQDGNGVLTGNVTIVDISGDTVGIYEYENSQQMEQEAKTIRDDGSMIRGTIYEWKAKPHFYKGGNIIVSYIGDNKEVIGTIEKFIGKQFAGAK